VSFAEELRDQEPTRPPCLTGAFLRNPPDWGDFADVEAAFNDPDIPHSVLTRALRARGITLNTNSLGRHRRGECQCPR